MLDLSKLTDVEKVRLVDNRWENSSSLWDVVKNAYKRNKKNWENNPEWLDYVPRKRSKARDNRSFLAMESVINTLTGRPSKPNTIGANDSDEAKLVAADLEELYLDLYSDLGIKDKMRKSLRHLFLARLMCLKIFWSVEKQDMDVMVRDPRHVRFSKKSTNMYDTEFAIDEIQDKPILDLIRLFPDKEKEILKESGYKTLDRVIIENPTDTYKEAWIGGNVLYVYKGMLLAEEAHPYWDWNGLKITANEKSKLGKLSGRNRRVSLKAIRKEQKGREGKKLSSFINNYFDNPIPPYIFGTVLALSDKPVGDTSLMEQVEPLQYEIDKRKRQISDNADLMNGIVKVDTNLVSGLTKADAQAANISGIWYGKGVRLGVTREVGKELPAFIANDMNHSIADLDNIFGSQPTFRGESTGTETATGRAILREASFQRLDELIGLMDMIHLHLYAWMTQMMMVRYEKEHYIKALGGEKAERANGIMKDDLQTGIKVRVIPGQILPEDRLFIAERAKEEIIAGVIDPLTYFELTGRDNPMKLAKRLEMYKINPFSILDLDDDDIQALQEANELFGGGEEEGGEAADSKAQQVAQLRQQAEELVQSDAFKSLPDREKKIKIEEIGVQLKRIQQAR